MSTSTETGLPGRTYRVIQWATGSIGRISIRHVVDTPGYELVGVYVTSAEKVGVDAGTLAGIDPVGVAATGSVDDVLALEADCVNYAPLYADVDEMCRILRSGKSIVTPTGWVFPAGLANQEPVARLAAACRDGGSSLFGAGIHPGFSGDLLPLTVARLCTRVDRVTVQEVADLAPHPSHAMNFDGLDFDVAVAKTDLTVRSGEIPAGTVGGMRHEWIALAGGRPVIVFRSFWKMSDDLEPNWGYGTVKYSVSIEGEPSTTLTLEPSRRHPTGDEGYWGRVWTAMNAVNAIPAVCAAPPGIHTHLDLPLVRPVGLVRPEPATVVRS
ncbi:hypothetical protein Ga0074812_13361 [Parafrankia irregularis]|uniref:2,4-diaminopentanoate dehydrogenase C-terminal domain-containing protein n=1 Tax=Parafrankia irregularis TaxID=795642 RepID=A0A0S4QWE6_9ACTN|nr:MULTISPECIES: dihydrodipicolinate reductase [Parafrankia]MBE3206484.1 dihydrodipicolinate reductase [Parafrankia sp. CH37]CUU59937.1 hypothetical protein Ga0074812_13361 [Parafrankia irregularis]